jgi:hypothetical protein
MATNRPVRRVPPGVLIVLGLLFSAVTLLFDGYLGGPAFQQLYALKYPATTGVVTHSGSAFVSGEEGGAYRPDIKYTYSVAGKEYQGTRLRYGQPAYGPRTTQRIVDAYPVGKPVEVHYAPHDPTDAVLKAGLEGTDLFDAMFMLPFNLIMLGFWVAAGTWIARRRSRPRAGGAWAWKRGDGLKVRLSLRRPLYTGAAVAGALAFAGVFVVSFGIGTNPSMPVMLTAWAVILVGGLSAFLWRRRIEHAKQRTSAAG